MVQEILLHFLQDAGPELLGKRFDEATPGIVAAMRKKGLTEELPLPVLVRDALFRLWRSVIPSGDIADMIRDRQYDKVLRLVEDSASALPPLSMIVETTAEAAIEVTF